MAPGADAQSVAGRRRQTGSQAARDHRAGGDAATPHPLTVPAELVETAPAKVNLYLHVTGRRADGYHLLDSLAVFPDIGDVLRAAPAAELSLALEGPFAGSLLGGENLVLRAARLLAGHLGMTAGARLVLGKNLPVASGLGGGSADAAAALRLLCRLWQVPPAVDLHRLALSLGADVPVCLASRPARMGGIGEHLGPAPHLPECGIVLANPGVPVATAAVFAARHGGFSPPAALADSWGDVAAMAADLAGLRNDLQASAVALCPAIGAVLAALAVVPGCRLARMSGSGATCFGLFPNRRAAEDAAARISRPGWWCCWGGGLR